MKTRHAPKAALNAGACANPVGIGRRARSRRGFTMMELMTVIVIIGITAGLGFVSLGQLQRAYQQAELDGTARELFIAAQNHLSEAEAQGTLGRIVKKAGVPTATAEEKERLLGYQPSDSPNSDEYYFVVGNEAHGDASLEGSAFAEMLPAGSIDASVLDEGTYVVKYNPRTATVLDVFYTWRDHSSMFGARNDGFAFTQNDCKLLFGASPSYTGPGNKNRQEYVSASGAKAIIGWYGGAQAQSLDRKELLKPTVKIENGDRLTAIVANPNWNIDSGKADAEKAHPTLSLIVKGETSKASAVIELVDGNGATKDTYKGVRIIQPETGGARFAVHLDDVTAQNGRFSKLFPDFIPGENITVQAVSSSTKQLVKIQRSATMRTNSLFASVAKTKQGDQARQTARVSSIRHLENLDNGVSGFSQTAPLAVPTPVGDAWRSFAPDSAAQTRDLSWPDFCAAISLGAFTATAPGNVAVYEGAGSSATAGGTYLPVDLPSGFAYDGAGHKVYGVVASISDNAGLFGTLRGGSVDGLELVGFAVSSSIGNAGALAGATEGTAISNVLVRDDVGSGDETTGVTASTGAAGGLVGAAKGGSIESCAAAVYVSGATAAGGLVGAASDLASGEASSAVAIGHSYAGGRTSDARYLSDMTGAARVNVQSANGAAGGLVGSAGNSTSVQSSYATASAAAPASSVGALIGSGAPAVTNSYAAGTAFNASGVVQSDVVAYWDASGERAEGADLVLVEEGSRQIAMPYDAKLVSEHGAQFSYKTIAQLDPAIAASPAAALPTFVTRHYGDWAPPAENALDTSLVIDNGDVLAARITMPVDQLQADGRDNYVSVLVRGTTSRAQAFIPFNVTQRDGAYVLDLGAGTGISANWLADAKAALSVSDGTATITFDLDDIKAQNTHFGKLFTGFMLGEPLNVAAYGTSKRADLESILNRGAAAWRVEGSDGRQRVVAAATNSLFADSSAPATAHVAYVRHLQNLDPVVSGVSDMVTGAMLDNDLAWDAGTYPTIAAFGSSSQVSGGFYGIYNAHLASFDGAHHTLSGFTVNAAPSAMSVEGAGGAGLFRLVNGAFTASNVRLADFSVRSEDGNAGALVATVNGGDRLTVDTVLAVSGDRVIEAGDADGGVAGGAAGGLVGLSYAPVTIRNSAASVLVSGQKYAGGLIGASKAAVAFSDAYAGGHTAAGSYARDAWNVASSQGDAGGLVGHAEGAIGIGGIGGDGNGSDGDGSSNGSSNGSSVVFSAASVQGGENQAAGGLVGSLSNEGSVTIGESAMAYVVAPVKDAEPVAGGSGATASETAGAVVGTSANAGEQVHVESENGLQLLVEVYDNCEVTQAQDGGKVSNVPLAGSSSAGAVSESDVGVVMYSDGGSPLAARSNPGGMMVERYTKPYDQLLEGREYPFLVSSKFGFGKRGEISYYGDWESNTTVATRLHNATFYYQIDDAAPQPVGGADAAQTIGEGIQNYLDVPARLTDADKLAALVPEGYGITSWDVRKATGDFGDDPQIVDANARVAENVVFLQSAYCTEDLVIVAHCSPVQKRCAISFWYDRTGNNAESGDSVVQIGETQVLIGDNAVLSNVRVPQSRSIAGYKFVGWYDGAGDDAAAVDFTSAAKLIADEAEDYTEFKAYARYVPIEHYTVTVDFVYESEDNSDGHLVNIVRESLPGVQAYTIQQEKTGSTELNEYTVALPDVGYTVNRVVEVVYHDDGAVEEVSNSEFVTLADDRKSVTLQTNEYHTHFTVIYNPPAQQVATYKVMCRLHDSAEVSNPALSGLPYEYSADATYSFSPYKSGAEDKLFGSSVGAQPDVKPLASFDEGGEGTDLLAGFTYTGTTLYPNEDALVEGDGNVVYLDYERNVHTLSFNTLGGTYKEPVTNAKYGQPLSSIVGANPSRTGYRFAGWKYYPKYGANKETELTGATMPDYDVEARAQWAPDQATYTVVYWRQSINDVVPRKGDGTVDWAAYDLYGAKTYDYIDAEQRTGTVDAVANLVPSDINKAGSGEFKGCKYNAARSDTDGKVINANGSTVLNVYYDRNHVEFTFTLSNGSKLPGSLVESDEPYATTGKVGNSYVSLYQHTDPDGNVFWTYDAPSGNTLLQVADSDASGAQYGIIDGETVELSRSGASWVYESDITYMPTDSIAEGQVYYGKDDASSEYFELGRTIWRTPYRYEATTSTYSQNPDQYGVDSYSCYQKLTHYSYGNYDLWYLGNSQYTGSRYIRIDDGSAVVDGAIYHENVTYSGFRRSYSYDEATDDQLQNGSDLFVKDANGHYVSIVKQTEPIWLNGSSEYAGQRYVRMPIYQEYSGQRYVNATRYTGNRYVNDGGSPFVGLYGQPFDVYGYAWPSGHAWQYRSTSGTSGMTIWEILRDPNGSGNDVTVAFTEASGRYSYYNYNLKQNLDGGYPTTPSHAGLYKADSYSLTFTYSEKFDGFKIVSSKVSSNDAIAAHISSNANWKAASIGGSANMSSQNNAVAIRYERQSYKLLVLDALNNRPVISEGDSPSVKYEAPLDDERYGPKINGKLLKGLTVEDGVFAPTDSEQLANGNHWDGKFYVDSTCTQEVAWDSATMPSHDVRVFVKFVLDNHTVKFMEQYPDSADAPAVMREVTLEENKTLDDIVDGQGEYKPEYRLHANGEAAGYIFDGWQYEEGGVWKTYSPSQPIKTDLVLYPKWVKDQIVVTKDVTVRYLNVDDPENPVELRDSKVVPGKAVGTVVTERAPEIEGYSVDAYYKSLFVRNGENEIVFKYRPAQGWNYLVRYVARYQTAPGIDPGLAASHSSGTTEYEFKSEIREAYNQYQLAYFTLPEGYENYHFIESAFGGETTASESRIIVRSDDAVGTYEGQQYFAEITYYIEPDASAISIDKSRLAEYNGATHNNESDDISDRIHVDESLNASLKVVYYAIDEQGSPLQDADAVNVGAYRQGAYIVLTLTEPGAAAEEPGAAIEKSYVLAELNEQNRYLYITPRKVRAVSASVVMKYSGDSPESGTPILTEDKVKFSYAGNEEGVQPAFIGSDGMTPNFPIDVFRLSPGITDNAFTCEPVGDTDPSNYAIIRVYGKLIVAVETDFDEREGSDQAAFYTFNQDPEDETAYELSFWKRSESDGSMYLGETSAWEGEGAPWLTTDSATSGNVKSVTFRGNACDGAFSGLTSLEKAVLAAPVASIGAGAFENSGVAAVVDANGDPLGYEEVAAMCPEAEGLAEDATDMQIALARLERSFAGTPYLASLKDELIPPDNPDDPDNPDGPDTPDDPATGPVFLKDADKLPNAYVKLESETAETVVAEGTLADHMCWLLVKNDDPITQRDESGNPVPEETGGDDPQAVTYKTVPNAGLTLKIACLGEFDGSRTEKEVEEAAASVTWRMRDFAAQAPEAGQQDERAPWSGRKYEVTRLELDDHIRWIGANAFNGMLELSAIALPANLEHVGEGAFNGTGIRTDGVLHSASLYAEQPAFSIAGVIELACAWLVNPDASDDDKAARQAEVAAMEGGEVLARFFTGSTLYEDYMAALSADDSDGPDGPDPSGDPGEVSDASLDGPSADGDGD